MQPQRSSGKCWIIVMKVQIHKIVFDFAFKKNSENGNKTRKCGISCGEKNWTIWLWIKTKPTCSSSVVPKAESKWKAKTLCVCLISDLLTKQLKKRKQNVFESFFQVNFFLMSCRWTEMSIYFQTKTLTLVKFYSIIQHGVHRVPDYNDSTCQILLS